MKKTFRLTIAFILTLNCVLGQTALPNKVSSFIKTMGLLPLNRVDTITKGLPKNFTTKSGWHIDYYAKLMIEDGIQLNVYSLIYNDSIFHSPWYPYKPKNIKYHPLKFVRETSDFLYLSIHNPDITDTIFSISKKQDNKWVQSSKIEDATGHNKTYRKSQIDSLPYVKGFNPLCDKIIKEPDTVATYKNGFNDILDFFSKNIKPIIDSCYINDNRMVSNLHMYLVIDANGKVIIARVTRPDLPLSCRTPIQNGFLQMDTWTPARDKGLNVCSDMKIPIHINWK